MGTAIKYRIRALGSLSLRRVRHHTDAKGRSGWIYAEASDCRPCDWMIVAEFEDGGSRRIVHENFRDARVAAGFVFEMHGVSFRFPRSVDEWSYDVRNGSLSFAAPMDVAA